MNESRGRGGTWRGESIVPRPIKILTVRIRSVFYSKDSQLQVKTESLQINYFHSYNLQRQEVHF
jgi:hypothetical protein